MPNIVYANTTCSTGTADGTVIRLIAGDAWAADDPLVLERPGLFSDEPLVHRTRAAPVVEQATASPGERRNIRRG